MSYRGAVIDVPSFPTSCFDYEIVFYSRLHVRTPPPSLPPRLPRPNRSFGINIFTFMQTQGNTLRRARYSAGQWASSLEYGASYVVPADDPTLVVTRAKEAAKFGDGVSGWSGYSLLTNNCETFACWCSTGRCVRIWCPVDVLLACSPSRCTATLSFTPYQGCGSACAEGAGALIIQMQSTTVPVG